MKPHAFPAFFAVVFLALIMLGAGSSSKSTRPPATPKHIQIYNKGVKAQENGNFALAVDYYRQALGKKNDFPDAWNNLGFSLRSIGQARYTEAVKAYQKALRLDPNHEQALEYLGESYLKQGALKKAHEIYLRLRNLGSREAAELKEKLDRILQEARQLR